MSPRLFVSVRPDRPSICVRPLRYAACWNRAPSRAAESLLLVRQQRLARGFLLVDLQRGLVEPNEALGSGRVRLGEANGAGLLLGHAPPEVRRVLVGHAGASEEIHPDVVGFALELLRVRARSGLAPD